MTPKQILQLARDKISDESKWIKGKGALDASGAEVNAYYNLEEAVQWCSIGAIYAASASFAPSNNLEAFVPIVSQSIQTVKDTLTKVIYSQHMLNDIVTFNDAVDTTYPMVIEAFDKAINTL